MAPSIALDATLDVALDISLDIACGSILREEVHLRLMLAQDDSRLKCLGQVFFFFFFGRRIPRDRFAHFAAAFEAHIHNCSVPQSLKSLVQMRPAT